MFRLFDIYASLFKSWSVIRYEQEGETYLLQLSAILQAYSRQPKCVDHQDPWSTTVPCYPAMTSNATETPQR